MLENFIIYVHFQISFILFMQEKNFIYEIEWIMYIEYRRVDIFEFLYSQN